MVNQRWVASRYATHARFVADLAEDALAERLALTPGERLLDVGCGDGALAERWVQRGAVVVGVDDAEDMVEAARRRGIDARRVDARNLPFVSEFDAAVSNAVLHWISDLAPVLTGVHRALRPGGRFVGECGGHGCVAAICTALRAVMARYDVSLALPWTFRSVDDVVDGLRAAGLEPGDVRIVPRPTFLATGIEPWLQTFASWAFETLPADAVPAAFREVVEMLRPALCDSRGRWTADYVRVRFVASRT